MRLGTSWVCRCLISIAFSLFTPVTYRFTILRLLEYSTEVPGGEAMEPTRIDRKLTAILSADAQGYSRLMGADEVGTVEILNAHRAIIDGLISQHAGRIVSTAGDGVLAEFSSAVDAVRCAIAIAAPIVAGGPRRRARRGRSRQFLTFSRLYLKSDLLSLC